mmetsp:Transcript_35640/g.106352  ORF Transcript_35640/g.106352 Transcript_35640/m.106352 type:complete len:242 (-) Transcript_35640:329-1054(-)
MPLIPPLFISLLLANFLQISVLPLALSNLDRPTTKPSLIHFPKRARQVLRVHHAHEAVTPALSVVLVTAYSGHGEGGVARSESVGELIFPYVLGQIPHEEPKIVLGKFGEGTVLPGFSRSGAFYRRVPVLDWRCGRRRGWRGRNCRWPNRPNRRYGWAERWSNLGTNRRSGLAYRRGWRSRRQRRWGGSNRFDRRHGAFPYIRGCRGLGYHYGGLCRCNYCWFGSHNHSSFGYHHCTTCRS